MSTEIIQPIYTAFEYVDKSKKVVKINDIITDTEVNGKKENLICHILALSLPLEYRDDFISKFDPNTYHNTFRETLTHIEDTIREKATIEGFKLKFSKGSDAYNKLQSVTGGGTRIIYSEEKLCGSLLTEIANPKDIESKYTSSDDLLYDIYRAGTVQRFFCVYLPDIYPTLLNVDVSSYVEIIALFESLNVDNFYQFITKPMYDTAKALIHSKNLFLKQWKDGDYDFVRQELDNPGNLYKIIYNMTRDDRIKRVEELKKIYLVFSFFYHKVVPKYKDIIYGEQSDLFINKFQDHADPLQFASNQMHGQLQDIKIHMMNFSSLHKGDFILKYFNTIIDLCQKLESCSAEILETASEWSVPLSNIIEKTVDHMEIVRSRDPININSIKSKKVPLIRVDKKITGPYGFLSPYSYQFPFTDKDNAFLYPSIEFFKIFKLGTEFLGIPPVDFYFSMVDTESKNFKSLRECQYVYDINLQIVMKNRVAQNSMLVIDQWARNPGNARKLSETIGKNIVLHSNNVFIGQRVSDKHGVDFIGKYMTMLRDGMDTIISDPFIIHWYKDKVEDMTRALRLYDVDENDRAAQVNCLQTLFGFSPKPVRISIEGVNPSTVVEKYVSEFLGTVFLFNVSNEAGLKDLILELQRTQPKLLDNPSLYEKFVNLMCIKVRNSVQKNLSKQQASVDEMKKMMTLISKYEYDPRVSIQESTVMLNRFFFFRHNLVLKY